MVKKNIEPLSLQQKRLMVSKSSGNVSIEERCRAVGIAKSSYYYAPRETDSETLAMMALIDKQYLLTPFYGYPRMTTVLGNHGFRVNRKRVARLMQLMGLQALYPKPRTSIGNKEHKIYPYLLRGLQITAPNHVWSTDLTYIGMGHGWMYLMAVMDWYSRYVIYWELNNTMEKEFCVDVLKESLKVGKPKIFNTDQGSQFTNNVFTSVLETAEINISMDGRGRALDNVFIERLWRTVKYEDIYIKNYENVSALRSGLERYFTFYNTERIHTKLNNKTPFEVYNGA